MIDPMYCRVMARYNRLANDTLYSACVQMSEEERQRERGGYYRSIHGLLNHLLYGDRSWLGRFVGQPFAVTDVGAELCADFEDLRAARTETDRAIADWAEGVTSAWLTSTLAWTSNVDRIHRERNAGLIVVHFFNHQTHHRGQVGLMVAQAGYEPPLADLPWLLPENPLV